MAARAWPTAAAVWLCLAGCRTANPSPAPRAPIEVAALAADFPGPDHGEVRLTLDVDNPEGVDAEAKEVTWEVWLEGRWFAAGLLEVRAALPAHRRTLIALQLPVVFKRLEVRPEPASVEVAVRGAVDLKYGKGGARVPFEATRRILARGAPKMGGPGEDD